MTRSIASFQRICKLLDYIHNHLDQPLSLDDLSQQSCWSRWQLQRVFQSEIGVSVAHYVRELKLSESAELLLGDSQRIIDIALMLGFNSEMSFSRAFKQHFGISPRAYRKLGQRRGLRKPIQQPFLSSISDVPSRLIEVSIESLSAFNAYGISGPIQGLLSPYPDFSSQVPRIWQLFNECVPDLKEQPLLGVIDVTAASDEGRHLRYLAGVCETEITECEPEITECEPIELISVPAQTYAVIKHRGPISGLAKTLEWFIFHWLPQSKYRGVDGFELERYPMSYQCQHLDAEMEYWLPVSPQAN